MIFIQKKDYFANCEETLEMATRLFDHMYFKELNESEPRSSNDSTDLDQSMRCECITEYVLK